MACPAGPNQHATGAGGGCAVDCDPGFVNYEHDPANGCEAPLASCGVTTLVADLAAPIGLQVDDGWVYYGSRGTEPDFHDGFVAKVPKGGGAPVVLATGLNLPLNMVIDATHLYWS